MSISTSELREEFNAVSSKNLTAYLDTMYNRIFQSSNFTQDEKNAQLEILKTLLAERVAAEEEKLRQLKSQVAAEITRKFEAFIANCR